MVERPAGRSLVKYPWAGIDVSYRSHTAVSHQA